MNSISLAYAGLLALISTPQDPNDTRLLSQAAVSADHIAFVYAEDLWICARDGTEVRRLTTHDGIESNPRFSPDGRSLAFTAQYDGNRDVYTIPVSGGSPRRLTWHPGADVAQDFTPDGSAVLFISAREVHTNRYQQLFTVPVEGGHPTRLPIPHAFKATFSPDGSKIAYVPLSEAFNQWKNYRGGRVSRIWLYDREDHSIEEIPQPEGRCNDTDPIWIGDAVYFRSDREGEFNLFAYSTADKTVTQLTNHDDFPILSASGNADTIAYEQAGYLHLFDTGASQSRRVAIGVAADLQETRARYVSGNRYIRSGNISPTGARAVFEFRGEIITVPAEKGDTRNITASAGVHERSPAWSPDGQKIAYFTDESGEYQLAVVNQDGRGDKRTFALGGAGFYDSPVWSPDGKWISYSDNSWTLYCIELESGDTRRIAAEHVYGPNKTQTHSWSPDSAWLAYTRVTETYFQQVSLYSLAEDRSYPITDGLSDVSEPSFDASGKYLYFFASTDAGPVRNWFAMSNADMEMTNSIYLAVLQKGEPSPLARESDEEPPVETDDATATDAGSEAESVDRTVIDFAGITNRILDLPVPPAAYRSLQAGDDGQIYYLQSTGRGGRGRGGRNDLHRFDLKKRSSEKLASGVSGFTLSGDHKKVLLASGGSYSIATPGPNIDVASGRLPTDDIEVKIDPAAEWRQIFNEAWRINRDYFYAPNMHGADWVGMREKYSKFLSDIAVRSDLNRIIQWMCSELAVGHHRVGGGDRLEQPESVPIGLLGADFEVADGRYRFAKVYGGLNWNPELRSPLTEPGVDVEAGEYLLAVEGRDLRPPNNLFSRFENKVGRSVRITVSRRADGTDPRTVSVVPIGNESALRNRDWVEGNLRKVDEATGGRVAYVYVPNTSTAGHAYFKRYFFPQAHKQAVIIDERYNGGGSVADYYIDILRRPHISMWAMRYGADLNTPLAAIQGPKVMLIDETAGSGGDLLPWMFRKLDMGPLIGKRTWGGLVGTLGFPILMDGGSVTAPNLAIWTEDGFIVENVGVPPDIEIEQWPADVIAGRDPQLEKAIEVILAELDANPPIPSRRPPFPIRIRR